MTECARHPGAGRYKRGCTECAKEHAKRWRQANPDRVRELEQRKRQRPEYVARQRDLTNQANERFRHEVLTRYGGDPPRCACCRTHEIVFLTLDHVNGDGASERRLAAAERGIDGRGFAGIRFYRWLKRNGWPDGYQVLCWNCNTAKHRLGVCPHRLRRKVRGQQLTLRM